MTFYFKGIASNRTYHLYDRLTSDCIDLKPDVIIMLIGVNDAWENYLPEQFPPLLRPMRPHLTEIGRRLQTELPNAKLLVLLPFMINTIEEKFPFHTVLQQYIQEIVDIIGNQADVVISLQDVFNNAEKTTSPALLARDGIHPTNLGHSVIAQAVLEVFD